MLAIVEDKEYFLVADKGRWTAQGILGLHYEPKSAGDCRRHEFSVGQRDQVDEENRSVETIQQRAGNRNGDGSLSDAARADDAQESPHHQLCRQGANDVVAPYHSGQLGWQAWEPLEHGFLA